MKAYVNDHLFSYITSWISWLKSEKRYSSHTIKAYHNDLLNFFVFMKNYRGSKMDIVCMKSLRVRTFRAWLASRSYSGKFSSSSTVRAVSVLRNFFRYLNKYHSLDNTEVFLISSPKSEKPLPRALSFEDTFLAIKHISGISDKEWINLRDKAILMIIYGCGLRISEALAFTPEDASSDFSFISVLGKGNKRREIPILRPVKEAIFAYIEKCPYAIGKGDRIFLSVRGKILHDSAFRKQLKILRELNALPEYTTPHAFRHSFASHLLSEGADIRVIQELLGHENLSSTQRYTKIDTKKLFSEYSKHHPRSS